MGLSNAGKTSIKKVVFEKMLPHESVFLEQTQTIQNYKIEKQSSEEIEDDITPYSFMDE